MYLLDTNVVSEFRKPRPHGGVAAWIAALAAHELYISVVTLGEIQRGIEKTRLQDAAKASEIEAWLDSLPSTSTVLDMDGMDFRLWARLMHGRTGVLANDGMIAAMAINRQLTVATRNIRDFEQFGVDLFNPFGNAA